MNPWTSCCSRSFCLGHSICSEGVSSGTLWDKFQTHVNWYSFISGTFQDLTLVFLFLRAYLASSEICPSYILNWSRYKVLLINLLESSTDLWSVIYNGYTFLFESPEIFGVSHSIRSYSLYFWLLSWSYPLVIFWPQWYSRSEKLKSFEEALINFWWSLWTQPQKGFSHGL